MALAAGAVLLLATAGRDTPDEPRGDLSYIEGSVPQRQQGSGKLVASVADLTAASVRRDQQALLFEAEVAAPVPKRLKTPALEFRWDISGDDGTAWTLSVAVAKMPHASLFSQGGYGSGTIDATFQRPQPPTSPERYQDAELHDDVFTSASEIRRRIPRRVAR